MVLDLVRAALAAAAAGVLPGYFWAVVLRPTETNSAGPDWRDRCAQIFCDLRAYLMGQSNA